jgi:deoxyribodipyrimidine photolyase
LIAYDASLTYGEWSASSGLGASDYIKRNVLEYSTQIDPRGSFIKKWVPELKDVPQKYIHDPWNMPEIEKRKIGLKIGLERDPDGETYPYPIKCVEYTNIRAWNRKWAGNRKRLSLFEVSNSASRRVSFS